MAVNLQSLGPLLKRSRRHAGLTQEELAESAGVSVRSLSDIERGAQQRPHVSTLRRLADALSLPPQERVAFLTAVDGHPPATPGRDGEHAGHVLDLDGMRRDERFESPAVLTFLLADLRDYTHFTMEQGDEAAARLTARFADLAHEVVTSYDGRVVELRGDEALCAFASTRNALRAALALQ